MGTFPTVLEISPEDFRRLHVLRRIRQRIEQTTRAKLEIRCYDPDKDGNAVGESPVNPAFVLYEVTWRWWCGVIPYRHRRLICAVELENWDTISVDYWRIFDQSRSKIITELTTPLTHGG